MERTEQLKNTVRDIHLPRYHELPTVGLYLEQVTRYVNGYLAELSCPILTPSMVSNYVKQRTIPGPVKKSYGPESIANLMSVALVKNVLSMEDIRLLERQGLEQYQPEQAYDYFCDEFENVLAGVFGLKAEMEPVGSHNTTVKSILRAAILAAVQKIYLDRYLDLVRPERKE